MGTRRRRIRSWWRRGVRSYSVRRVFRRVVVGVRRTRIVGSGRIVCCFRRVFGSVRVAARFVCVSFGSRRWWFVDGGGGAYGARGRVRRLFRRLFRFSREGVFVIYRFDGLVVLSDDFLDLSERRYFGVF